MRSIETTGTCTTSPEKCNPDACNVRIGDSVYRSQCSNGGSDTSSPAPTNGVCTTDNNECSVKADGRCTTCAHESFMFQGGCYRADQTPGQTMCQTAQDGKCTSPQTGYFIPPDATKTDQSIMACNDTTEITLTNKKKYVGVANCKTCGAPAAASDTNAVAATCTACEDGYFVESAACTKCHESCLTCEGGNGADKYKSCKDGYFLGATSGAAGKCIQCNNLEDQSWPGVDNCAKCTSSGQSGTAATCTECADNYYLKTNGGATSCVTNCGEGFFPTTVNSIKKCVSCSETSNGGIANCARCSLKASSARAGAAVTCTECITNKLSPLGDACLTVCPAGTYDDNSICTPCHTSCSSCSDAAESSCTACYPGSVLNKIDSSTAGTCIPECTRRYAENCEAGMCTAVLGGSKYCSKCAVGYAPIDGMCTKVATTRRDTSVCTASNGVCTACTGDYALLSGGCYNTKALPGMAVCTAATSGSCTTCANGQVYTNNNCPACAEGCSTCTSGNTQQCTKCLAGYYLDNTAKACKKCSENSNGITGISNCVNCAPPTGNHKAITYCSKIDSSAIGTGGDGMDRNIFSISVVTCASSLGTLTIGGLAGFFVNDRPIAIAGMSLLEETDPSTVYESASLCNVPTKLLRRRLSKSFSERTTTSTSAHRE